jgi:hypothetical protein
MIELPPTLEYLLSALAGAVARLETPTVLAGSARSRKRNIDQISFRKLEEENPHAYS